MDSLAGQARFRLPIPNHSARMPSPASVPLLLALSVILALAGCGGPVEIRVPAEQALTLTTPWTFRVTGIHDALKVREPTPGATHLIDITITGPPELAGKVLALPYDEWAMGAPPPRVGSVHTLAPRTWIAGNPKSRGRPMKGFDQ